MIGTALRAQLLTNPAIVAHVAGRVFPLTAPEGEQTPLIVYQRISATRRLTHTSGPVGFVQARMQIDVYTTTYDSNRALANLVRQTLDGQAFVTASITVQLCKLENELEDFDSAAMEYRTALDFIVTYEE